MLEYVADRNSNAYRGDLARYGVAARVYFATLGRPGEADPDSVFRLYAELGAGRQHGVWSSGDAFARNDLALGAGWHFGWQLDTARTGRVELVTERTTCKTCGPPMPGPDLDASLIVSCALVAVW